MSIIDELSRKLKSANRKREIARKFYQTSEAETKRLRSEFEQSVAVVAELEAAISLLRNNLKTTQPATDEKVVAFRRD